MAWMIPKVALPPSLRQYCIDEAQKAETVLSVALSAVNYVCMYALFF